MDPISRVVAAGAAGAGAAGAALYVDDVFNTYLYDGNDGSNRAINNGIDLSGEGGCVWLKHRGGAFNGIMVQDTERFVSSSNSNQLDTSSSAAEADFSGFTSFNSNGFSVSDFAGDLYNANGEDYVSWSFRKAPGFFDVVTYTGNGTSQNISHNLGSVPGAIFIKCTTTARDWVVYHRSTGATKYLKLNTTDGTATNSFYFDDTTPTASSFRVADAFDVNQNGQTFVAYLFAHDDQSFGTNEDEAIVKCGSYTGNGSTSNVVTVGFEPQWLLVKRTDGSGQDWHLFDVMRGMIGNRIARLYPNTSGAEAVASGYGVQPLANGFDITASGTDFNGNNFNYIYIAIRRPHKPPEAGTDVFAVDTKSVSSANTPSYSANFPVDLAIRRNNITSTDSNEWCTRITNSLLYSNKTDTEVDGGSTFLDFFAFNNGWATDASADSTDYLWMLKRAPGFFDVVSWSGNGSANRAINHNLTVIPELYITKRRTTNENWIVTTDDLIASAEGFFLNTTNAKLTGLSAFSSVSSPTSSVFYVGSDSSINGSSDDYIAYLFASLDGISKIGTYTGTGNDGINVNCGFTAGARFVMIKRTDSTGNWFVWDSTRGIVSGNDPYIFLNSTSAEDTSTDHIDPLNSGFIVNGSNTAQINVSGGTYLFLAIA